MAHPFEEATVEKITTIARNFLRDYPRFFQVSFDAVGRTYELGHPNISLDGLWVATYVSGNSPVVVEADTSASAFYSLDQRNGVLRFNTTPPANSRVMVEGYYYEWVLPSDLEFYADHAIHQHIYNLEVPLENMTEIVLDTIGMAAVVETLYGLLTEYSRDIDVTTSESVHIPASQRFRMVQSLLEYWQRAYERQAKSLNIGLDRIEILNLRRVSRTTGYLVPIYKQRELGNYGPIERIFPEIDDGILPLEDGASEGDGDLRDEVIIQLEPQQGYSNIAPLGY
jgi:hypothetical protein